MKTILLLIVSTLGVSASTINVPSGGDFQSALNSAHSGDVITLAAGASYRGQFVLPVNSGSAYITIRTSTPDSAFPAGVRVTPASASLFPKLVADPSSSLPVIRTVPGSNHYKFIGVEISPTVGTYQLQLVQLGDGSETSLASLPTDFVIDRCYIHGDAQYGARRGIAMNVPNVTVMNSYFSDFKVVGPDSQALASWNGPGPISITNNYLEASGENVLIGGQDPTIQNLVPTGITIRQNHFSKPLSWRVGDPSYSGTHWTVKNLLEFKNARQVIVDGNLFENNWADAQNGFAILFTPRNQDGTAPWSVVSDAQFTNNIVRHAGSGINILGTDDIYSSQQLHNVTIRNNLIYDITQQWGGTGRLFQVLNTALNVTIDHNTGFPGGAILIADELPSVGLHYTNNLSTHGDYGFFGSGTAEGLGTLAAYFPGAVLEGNGIIGANAGLYPAGNFFPASVSAVDFASDDSLQPASPLHNAATDGTDVGVNFDALNAAQSGGAPVSTQTGAVPVISAGGIVNGATFQASIGAGGIVSLFGTNLAGASLTAGSAALPTSLAGTQVLVNGAPTALLYVSPTQINLQLPTSVTGTISIVVVSGGTSSAASSVTVGAVAPGVFSGSASQGAILNQDSTVNAYNNPAAIGSIIQIFATGLGSTNSPADTVVAYINGKVATVHFSAAAPGYPGLYQVNATVPASTPVGSAIQVVLEINGQFSNTVTFAVGH